MTRFFVPSQGDTHKWTAKEMASHSDFVYLDLAATYQTIGAQTVRGTPCCAAEADMQSACEFAMSRHEYVAITGCRAGPQPCE